MDHSLYEYSRSAEYIKERTGGFRPQTGIILGSGLSGLADLIEDRFEIPYAEIPGFLISTAPGHEGKLIFGTLEGRRLVCMSGRFHRYEGYSYEELAKPVRVLALLGIEQLIVTNAAGAINTDYSVGDVMLIKDHIKLFGDSPMMGPNVAEFGPRFFDTTDMYSRKLRALAKDCAKDCGMTLREGVYFFFPGPQFESPAEIRAARLLGGDAAGMSTVTEALTAAQMKLPLLGISLMTNMAAGVLDQPLSSEEVNRAGEEAAPRLQLLVRTIIKRIGEADA
ncbi:MAG: purine-nucleoside phosphorylase [Firmicutes bacterium]|nr:purine-nucleoside phosphorylase [Bacillota bacterium]